MAEPDNLNLKESQRMESDSLGTVAVPAGALFGAATVRALDAMSISGRSLGDYPEIIEALCRVKLAALRANLSAGDIDGEIAGYIESALDEILSGHHREQFPVDMLSGGGCIAFNANLNEVTANLANRKAGRAPGQYEPVHPRQHVNLSQSTADTCHTAFRLALLERIDSLDEVLVALDRTLSGQADASGDIYTLSRTCLRDALPVSLATYFSAWCSALARLREDLASSRTRLLAVNLGGTVIGDGSGASRQYRDRVAGELASICGRPLRLALDLFDQAQNMDELVELSGVLSRIAQLLLKIARDLRLLSSGPDGGFGELVLPMVLEGSSFFKGKDNPVVPETVMIGAFQVMGSHYSVEAAACQAELNLNVFESSAVVNLIDSLRLLGKVVAMLDGKCLRELRADTERCRELLSYARAGGSHANRGQE
ncbi:MAG: aspartate ammonia-lyase [Candidatus Melainabacteria bacterium]|nr:aspartate ammonia-lyase [Candidatus Melainabacteria bacterium]